MRHRSRARQELLLRRPRRISGAAVQPPPPTAFPMASVAGLGPPEALLHLRTRLAWSEGGTQTPPRMRLSPTRRHQSKSKRFLSKSVSLRGCRIRARPPILWCIAWIRMGPKPGALRIWSLLWPDPIRAPSHAWRRAHNRAEQTARPRVPLSHQTEMSHCLCLCKAGLGGCLGTRWRGGTWAKLREYGCIDGRAA